MKKKQIKQIDFTINDSCLVCDVKTDGSVLCNNCESESEEYLGPLPRADAGDARIRVPDYSELRRLHAEIDTGLWPFKIRALLDALPGLLDEAERLTGDNRCAWGQVDNRDEAIISLRERIAQLEAEFEQRLSQHMALADARIAQLEAAIQELIEGGSMDEKDMLLAYAALAEGKGPAK